MSFPFIMDLSYGSELSTADPLGRISFGRKNNSSNSGGNNSGGNSSNNSLEGTIPQLESGLWHTGWFRTANGFFNPYHENYGGGYWEESEPDTLDYRSDLIYLDYPTKEKVEHYVYRIIVHIQKTWYNSESYENEPLSDEEINTINRLMVGAHITTELNPNSTNSYDKILTTLTFSDGTVYSTQGLTYHPNLSGYLLPDKDGAEIGLEFEVLEEEDESSFYGVYNTESLYSLFNNINVSLEVRPKDIPLHFFSRVLKFNTLEDFDDTEVGEEIDYFMHIKLTLNGDLSQSQINAIKAKYEGSSISLERNNPNDSSDGFHLKLTLSDGEVVSLYSDTNYLNMMDGYSVLAEPLSNNGDFSYYFINISYFSYAEESIVLTNEELHERDWEDIKHPLCYEIFGEPQLDEEVLDEILQNDTYTFCGIDIPVNRADFLAALQEFVDGHISNNYLSYHGLINLDDGEEVIEELVDGFSVGENGLDLDNKYVPDISVLHSTIKDTVYKDYVMLDNIFAQYHYPLGFYAYEMGVFDEDLQKWNTNMYLWWYDKRIAVIPNTVIYQSDYGMLPTGSISNYSNIYSEFPKVQVVHS